MAKKRFAGIVVSNKMTNTVVVALERKVPHPRYGKLMKATTKLKADTAGQEYMVGDMVVIEETRPMSRDKYFKVVKKGGLKNGSTQK